MYVVFFVINCLANLKLRKQSVISSFEIVVDKNGLENLNGINVMVVGH